MSAKFWAPPPLARHWKTSFSGQTKKKVLLLNVGPIRGGGGKGRAIKEKGGGAVREDFFAASLIAHKKSFCLDAYQNGPKHDMQKYFVKYLQGYPPKCKEVYTKITCYWTVWNIYQHFRQIFTLLMDVDRPCFLPPYNLFNIKYLADLSRKWCKNIFIWNCT